MDTANELIMDESAYEMYHQAQTSMYFNKFILKEDSLEIFISYLIIYLRCTLLKL